MRVASSFYLFISHFKNRPYLSDARKTRTLTPYSLVRRGDELLERLEDGGVVWGGGSHVPGTKQTWSRGSGPAPSRQCQATKHAVDLTKKKM